jgi:hypothetical protein
VVFATYRIPIPGRCRTAAKRSTKYIPCGRTASKSGTLVCSAWSIPVGDWNDPLLAAVPTVAVSLFEFPACPFPLNIYQVLRHDFAPEHRLLSPERVLKGLIATSGQS